MEVYVLVRVVGTSIGVLLILLILLARGLPVFILIKSLGLFLIFFVAVAFIYAGLSSDS